MHNHSPIAHWVRIERENHPAAYVGPFANKVAATVAMNEAPLVEALCEEDAIDAAVTTDIPRGSADVHIIDPANQDHTGAQAKHQRTWSGEHKAYVCATCRVDLADVDAATLAEYVTAGLPAVWEDCTAQ